MLILRIVNYLNPLLDNSFTRLSIQKIVINYIGIKNEAGIFIYINYTKLL
jgi:hypothetical protein